MDRRDRGKFEVVSEMIFDLGSGVSFRGIFCLKFTIYHNGIRFLLFVGDRGTSFYLYRMSFTFRLFISFHSMKTNKLSF